MASAPSAPPEAAAPPAPESLAPDPAALSACLRAGGRLPEGSVAAVDVVRSLRANATGLFRLALRYSRGAPAAAPATAICKVFADDLYERSGAAEARFYLRLAPAMEDPPAPALLGAVDEPGERQCVLLLEDLEPEFSLAGEPLRPELLERAVDELARLHAAWWEHPRLRSADFDIPQNGFSRSAQALPPDGIRKLVREGEAALAGFMERCAAELTEEDRRLLDGFPAAWGERFAARVAGGRGLTLCHGDFHLHGNVFFPRQRTVFFPRKRTAGAAPRFVDWNQHRRGLGAHDLAYGVLCHPVEATLRPERDGALLRRYHAVLRREGVSNYAFEQCEWDFRFSLLTNLFLAFFTGRYGWLAKTMDAVRAWDAAATLHP